MSPPQSMAGKRIIVPVQALRFPDSIIPSLLRGHPYRIVTVARRILQRYAIGLAHRVCGEMAIYEGCLMRWAFLTSHTKMPRRRTMRPMSKPTFSKKNDSPINTRRKANGISTSAKARKNDQNG